MFDLYFRKKRCIPSRDALKDMGKHDIPPTLVRAIIEEGEDYRNSRMGKKEVGCAIRKEKSILFVKLVPSYSYSLDEDVWLIKHVGIKRRSK
jgi:hypothetical protein